MTREEALERLKYIAREDDSHITTADIEALEMAIAALEAEPCDDMGEVSDGYHTFNQLYYQRAVLFATIVNQNKDRAWKSWKHDDEQYCFDSNGEWFIVGIDTPEGSYTYHYSKEYWDMFKCDEIECGKHWDGHTEKDVTRLLSLEPCEDAVSREAVMKLKSHKPEYGDMIYAFDVELLPSVIPKQMLCKDCKWWKDSDGAYRRGIGAESHCPINCKTVFEGNGYCFLYKPQKSEDNE